ncbi:MAG: response regulator, partial [Gammaproteobacteria bacterium]
GGPRHPEPSRAFVIVTEFNRSIQGFLVDMVDRIVNLNWEQILPPPRTAGHSNYLTAVTEVDGKLVEIIDVEKVLSEVIGMEEEVSEEWRERAREESRPYEPHILVADDSMVARNQIKRTLDSLGIPCTLAMDGCKALDILQKWAEEEPDRLRNLAMVISDIEMPEMDGYTFTTRVREDPRLSDIYILLHTSLSGVFNENMVKKVGADEFIAKFKPDLLAESVLRQVEKHGQEVREAS